MCGYANAMKRKYHTAVTNPEKVAKFIVIAVIQ